METEIEPELNLGFQALIPEEYIADGKERLQYYKALSSCRDEAGIVEIVDEVRAIDWFPAGIVQDFCGRTHDQD